MTKAFLPQMKARNHGHIVTIASALGLFTTAFVEVCCAWMTQINPNHYESTSWHLSYFTPVCRITVPVSLVLSGCLQAVRSGEMLLIPPLEPLYTAQQSMKAILGEQEMVCIPRIMYIPFIARALLPWEANVVTYRFMGGDKCMLPFIKNAEIKTLNGHMKSSNDAF
ncbi:hypothetical protein GOODEAATRI_018409 [Goodea atripinnis]|uniref:Uncharacterized protein n=1 Tax=Goodea atripinnis TaxID=208336 RepID=A0ABV0NVN5_9TELE